MRRVVVTGIGGITSIGNTIEESWKEIQMGSSGLSYIREFDTSDINIHTGGEILDFYPEDYMDKKIVRRSDRFIQLFMASSTMAIDDANLKSFDNSGIVAGTCWGAASLTLENAAFMLDNDYDNISMFFIPGSLPHMAAVETAIRYGIFGPSLTISNACATGSSVIVEAYRYIKDGLADVMVAGASEAPINKLALIALDKLHILSRIENPVEASRPFDKDRDGYVLSEGAATLILEELGHAIKRNAKIYGEIIGYSTNTDGLSVIKGSVASKARCISDALKYARVLPEEVDYINANGTSTIDNDIVETKALKSALGSHAYNIPISSTKSMIGHSLGASGAIEAAVTLLSMRDSVIHPTINLKTPDAECDLNYVPNNPIIKNINAAISESFGFGGTNAVLVFKKYG